MSDPELWGTPPRLKGSYEGHDYAPLGKLGPREAGSIAANTMIAQPAILAASWEIEQLAQRSMPTLTPGMAGLSSWFVQTLIFLALKVIANLLRNNGGSLFRDVAAWAFSWVMRLIKRLIAGWLHSLAEWILPSVITPDHPDAIPIDEPARRRWRLAARIRKWRDQIAR